MEDNGETRINSAVFCTRRVAPNENAGMRGREKTTKNYTPRHVIYITLYKLPSRYVPSINNLYNPAQ